MAKISKAVEPVLRDNILRLADACQAAWKVGPKSKRIRSSSLSGEFHGDPKFLDKLRGGKCSFTARKYDTAIAWFDEWFASNPDVTKPAITEPFPKPGKLPA